MATKAVTRHFSPYFGKLGKEFSLNSDNLWNN
jgi:hypothetical protein